MGTVPKIPKIQILGGTVRLPVGRWGFLKARRHQEEAGGTNPGKVENNQLGAYNEATVTKPYFTTEQAREAAQKVGVDWQKADFNLEQFRKGMDVELEHGSRDSKTNVSNDDPTTTGKIALAHLKEIADYYDRLEKMEKEAESTKAVKPIRFDPPKAGRPVVKCGKSKSVVV